MIKSMFKRLLSSKTRRFLRILQSRLRSGLQPFLYLLWIWKYDQRKFANTDCDLPPEFDLQLAAGCHLAPDALFQVAKILREDPDTDLVYSDSDELNALGLRCRPYLKPDWDPYLFLSQEYIQPFYVIRKGASYPFKKVRHIPLILAHQRRLSTPTVSASGLRNSRPVNPIQTLDSYKLPLISIIIPTKDGVAFLKPCIDSLFATTPSLRTEILIINNNSEQEETFAYFERLQKNLGPDGQSKDHSKPGSGIAIRILDYPHPFNYAAINNFAVKQAQGEMLLFLNNDIEAISPGWLEAMLALAVREDVGAVGAKLLYPNDTIQHAGIVLGIDGTARHVLTGLPRHASGYFGNLQNIHCCSAVTAACLMMRRAVFEAVGGFDEVLFPVTFNDIDLCLKVGKAGYHVLYTPFAELYHKESATRGEDISPEKRARVKQEKEHFIAKWGKQLGNDPFYNQNLSLKSTDYFLTFPPRHTMTSVHP